VCFHINSDRDELIELYLSEFCDCDGEGNGQNRNSGLISKMPSLEKMPQSLRGTLHTKRSANLWDKLETGGTKDLDGTAADSRQANNLDDEPPLNLRGVSIRNAFPDADNVRGPDVIRELSLENEIR